jgi:lipoyl(octanoyl) transferase
MSSKKNKTLNFFDLGEIDYKLAWDFQEKIFNNVVQTKTENRKVAEALVKPTSNFLIFCEHPSVYTLGKSGDEKNLLVNVEFLNDNNATFYKINRGGDITFHGLGQLVGYPILDLDNFFTDIHKYLRLLEDVIIDTIKEYGLKGMRYPGFTGVWLDSDIVGKERKICAMGVRCSRWVTMHGWALNANTDLNYFKNIVPCGINDKNVTSIEKEIGVPVDMNELKKKIYVNFCRIFEIDDLH